MTNEELVDRIQKGINPGDNMEQLYQQNYRYIYKIAIRYAHQDDMDDLLQEAYFGLYEAVNRYEDTAGVLFMTYAGFWIKQSITRYLENNGRSIRVPSGMHNKIIKYKRVIAAFEMQLGRKPTDEELCQYVRVSMKALQAIKKEYYAGSIQSLDEVLPGMDDVLMGDSIPDPNTDIENGVIDSMIEKSKRVELWQIVKDNVSDKENTAITARFRRNMTLEAVGHMMGISGDRVRQLETNALRKLSRPRIIRLLEKRFEVNYARAYHGSVTKFRYSHISIVEDITIRNIERQLEFIHIILERENWRYLLTRKDIELAMTYHLIDENMELVKVDEVMIR